MQAANGCLIQDERAMLSRPIPWGMWAGRREQRRREEEETRVEEERRITLPTQDERAMLSRLIHSPAGPSTVCIMPE